MGFLRQPILRHLVALTYAIAQLQSQSCAKSKAINYCRLLLPHESVLRNQAPHW